ncbi:hypothetical protein PR048_027114 [Dryococelus australis]|uniref:Uncharacterized protein n=1 Tax=Dryococelus australis TaxID=614101 RepID=A0ABQ9GEJ1_9NEOP|nr:hypothetical protein PR048_027114 [Dryococelus australis]
MWESCRTLPLAGGFSRGSPISPVPSFRRRSMLTSTTRIGSQDLAVESQPNLFSHSLFCETLRRSGAGMQGRGEAGGPRGNPPASGIVQHDCRVRESGSEPAEDRARIAVVGGEYTSRCATAAPALIYQSRL